MSVDYHAWTHRPANQGGTDPLPPAALWAVVRTTTAQNVGSDSSIFVAFHDFWTNDDTVFGTSTGGLLPPYHNTAGDTKLVANVSDGIFAMSMTCQWEDGTYERYAAISKESQLGFGASTLGQSTASASDSGTLFGAGPNILDVVDFQLAGLSDSTINPSWQVVATNSDTVTRQVSGCGLTVLYWPAVFRFNQVY